MQPSLKYIDFNVLLGSYRLESLKVICPEELISVLGYYQIGNWNALHSSDNAPLSVIFSLSLCYLHNRSSLFENY